MGGAMIGKSLMQFSVDGWGCVPTLLFDVRPNYGGGNEENGDLLQKVTLPHSVPLTLQRPLPTPTSTRDSWTLTGKSGSVSWGYHYFFLLRLGVHMILFVPLRVCFPSPV